MPEIGELLIKRLILQFRRAYKRNAKSVCLASTNFLAHLANQQVVGVIIPLQICALLLEKPTDDSVEVAVSFLTEVGQTLQDISPQGFNRIFDRFRGILHEGEIDKRVQYTIELLFAVRKTGFAEHVSVKPELDLVDIEDQITHDDLSLDDTTLDPEERLNFFHFDEQFVQNEAKYDAIRKEILGEETIEELEGREDEEGEDGDEEQPDQAGTVREGVIQDNTETELINLRRTIYLTIMSSVDFNECAHKLLKIKLPAGQEMELCNMLLECCSQERTYMRFYGLLGQRFCMLDKVYQESFDRSFGDQYTTIHRLETNKLRNVAKFFAHLLHSDALPWSCLDYIHLTEEETTSSSRIFIKIIFQELAEYLGLQKLNERLKDPFMQKSFEGIFPKDNPKHTRFAINFFTSIGLGGITEDLREHLKNAPKRIAAESSSSDSDSSESESESSSDSDSSSSSSSSSSESEDDRKRRRSSRR
jgi:pre-mRNA-splicing factor CWC22